MTGKCPVSPAVPARPYGWAGSFTISTPLSSTPTPMLQFYPNFTVCGNSFKLAVDFQSKIEMP